MLTFQHSVFKTTIHVSRKQLTRFLHAGQTRQNDHGPSQSSTNPKNLPLHQKLVHAWKSTPTKWYPLPVLVGALLLVAINYRKRHLQSRSDKEPLVHVGDDGRDVLRLQGPFQVHVLGALPLRNLSRLWGYLNSLQLPRWFRPTGFHIYAFIFGCNLSEIEPSDLREYKSLGEFFYRRLKDGARPIDERAPLVSPADGKILHFGTVEGLRVEQVKGLTYSLDALLGSRDSAPSSPTSPSTQTIAFANRDHAIVDDREFANVNGIEYSLDQLLGSSSKTTPESSSPPSDDEAESGTRPKKYGAQTDASLPPSESEPSLSRDASVAMSVGIRPALERSASSPQVKPHHRLFFAVVYLAPGDYHRFHSPAAWVVEKRRHFVGELFSVSPYMVRRLANLFVLNERVALLGRWKHGFFSMVPVGATNVGSILLNFDKDLRTNERGRLPPPGTFTEAVYSNASTVLRGQPLRAGEEMGGFCLGSTIVLVFEAPKEFVFSVQAGEKVKVGQRLGDVRVTKDE